MHGSLMFAEADLGCRNRARETGKSVAAHSEVERHIRAAGTVNGGIVSAVDNDVHAAHLDLGMPPQPFQRPIGGPIVVDKIAIHPRVVMTKKEAEHLDFVPAHRI